MPGLDRAIDPVTRDYVDDGKGDYVETSTVETQVYIRLNARRGLWWGSSKIGSELYQLERENADTKTIRRADEMIRAALRPLVDAKRIDELDVEHDVDQTGRDVIVTSMRDLQQGAKVELDLRPFRP